MLLSGCGANDPASGRPEEPAWVSQIVCEGVMWRNYTGYDRVSDANQIVNVLEIDLSRPEIQLSFAYRADKQYVSRVAAECNAIVATNASFGVPQTYIRINGENICEIDLEPGTSNWWKHEAAIGFDGDRSFGFFNYDGMPAEAVTAYRSSSWKNLYSTTPILIDDYDFPEWDLKTDEAAGKNYGGKRSHILNRHPRTVLATKADGTLLLMTVDGRWNGRASGMSCEELRSFLDRHFHPRYAVSMDGGGSTAMFVKRFGSPDSGIVNYPCEGTGETGEGYVFDHSHERRIPTFFVVTRKE